jgi:hypothetical protein
MNALEDATERLASNVTHLTTAPLVANAERQEKQLIATMSLKTHIAMSIKVKFGEFHNSLAKNCLKFLLLIFRGCFVPL